jgi:hypothetical protein
MAQFRFNVTRVYNSPLLCWYSSHAYPGRNHFYFLQSSTDSIDIVLLTGKLNVLFIALHSYNIVIVISF